MSLNKPHRIRLGVFGRGLMAAVGVVALIGAGAGIVSAVSTSPQSTVAPYPGSYVPLTPILNGAGWYQPTLSAPVSLAQPGASMHWTNITGLVANTSRFGDELALMRSSGEIGQSILRERLDWVWDGTTFVSDQVTERIVDRLEFIDVEKKYRNPFATMNPFK